MLNLDLTVVLVSIRISDLRAHASTYEDTLIVNITECALIVDTTNNVNGMKQCANLLFYSGDAV
jgi:hypothetical protein